MTGQCVPRLPVQGHLPRCSLAASLLQPMSARPHVGELPAGQGMVPRSMHSCAADVHLAKLLLFADASVPNTGVTSPHSRLPHLQRACV